jgi:hypothetical protein
VDRRNFAPLRLLVIPNCQHAVLSPAYESLALRTRWAPTGVNAIRPYILLRPGEEATRRLMDSHAARATGRETATGSQSTAPVRLRGRRCCRPIAAHQIACASNCTWTRGHRVNQANEQLVAQPPGWLWPGAQERWVTHSKLVGPPTLWSSRMPRPTFTSSMGRGDAHSTHSGRPCRPSSPTLAFTLHLGPPIVPRRPPPVAGGGGAAQLVRGRAASFCASGQLVSGVRRFIARLPPIPGRPRRRPQVLPLVSAAE